MISCEDGPYGEPPPVAPSTEQLELERETEWELALEDGSWDDYMTDARSEYFNELCRIAA